MSTAFRPNLSAYLARIGLERPVQADLASLRAIVAAHTRNIVFENLSVLSGEGVSLRLADLEEKLVHRRRGGYCFEHMLYLAAVLETIGFAPQRLISRVRWNHPEEVVTGRTHMLLLVPLEGRRWLLDAGVGGVSGTAPIDIDTCEPQANSHDRRRILKRPNDYLQQVELGGKWCDLSCFTLEQAELIDYELGNWWTSTSPEALFTNHLIVTRAADEGRYVLFDELFTVRDLEGAATETPVRDAAHRDQILHEVFGLKLDRGTPIRFPLAEVDSSG